MSITGDPRGSVWQKWDLHVHTPASFHWRGERFHQMNAAAADQALTTMIEAINVSQVRAFGIMDYWTFDGYLRLRRFLREHPEAALTKAVFPGMELRIQAPVDYRLNIHVLLSDELSDQQLQDFRSALRVGGIGRGLSDEALIAYARTLDESKARLHGPGLDLSTADGLFQLGARTAEVTRESLERAFSEIPEGSGYVILPYDTSDGLQSLDWKSHPHADNYFMRSAAIFETRDGDNVDLFLGRTTAKNERFIHNFKKTMGADAKPVVCGSDAHRLSDYGNYPSGKACWIKADPTFAGIRQIVNEPAARCYIGEIPDKVVQVRDRRAKYIKRLSIAKKPASRLEEAWFQADIPFSYDLVAVIGNKGSGKSALADVLGLLGDTKNHPHFSFLNGDKFRRTKRNLAREFEATLEWASGVTVSRSLDGTVDAHAPEAVKYIPQHFLEAVCNEIGTLDRSNFDKELKAAIFSHVAPDDRLGWTSLDDLIAHRTEEVRRKILLIKDQVRTLNAEIAVLEERAAPDYRETLEGRVRNKAEELRVHEEMRPPPLQAVNLDPENAGANRAATEIERIHRRLAELSGLTVSAKDTGRACKVKLSTAARLNGQLNNLEWQAAEFVREQDSSFQALSVDPAEVVKLTIDRSSLAAAEAAVNQQLDVCRRSLDPLLGGSLAAEKADLERRLPQLQDELDAPNRRRHDHEALVARWEARLCEIVGEESTPDTLEHYRAALAALDGLPDLIGSKCAERSRRALDIYGEIRALADTYRQLYRPVQEFIEQHPLISGTFRLEFDVSVVEDGFAAKFFDTVGRNAAGSFCGAEEGAAVLRGILDAHDFGVASKAAAFPEEVLRHLGVDCRSSGARTVKLKDQLRKGQTPEALYDFLFSLDYLSPRYTLKLAGKSLNQLSPGERGTLLLVFYLLIDRDDIPLIIDQPEENLDNQTIYTMLVPCILEAKKRRQIVIVTHNPNLAVNCDAEQIVCASLDPANGNRIEYLTGSIENPLVNRRLIDILEGTRPAFDSRDAKYLAG